MAGHPTVDETLPTAPRLSPPTLRSVRQSADPAGTQAAGGTRKLGCLCINKCRSPGDPVPSAGVPAPPPGHGQHTHPSMGRPASRSPRGAPPPVRPAARGRPASFPIAAPPGVCPCREAAWADSQGARRLPGAIWGARVPSSGAAGPGRLAGPPGDPLHPPQAGGQDAPGRGLPFDKMVSGRGALSFPGGR